MGEAKIKEATKAEEFEKNPDDFVNIHDLLIAVGYKEINGQKGLFSLNNCRSKNDCYISFGKVQEELDNRRDQITILQAQKTQGGIQIAKSMPVPPNGERKPFKLFHK